MGPRDDSRAGSGLRTQTLSGFRQRLGRQNPQPLPRGFRWLERTVHWLWTATLCPL